MFTNFVGFARDIATCVFVGIIIGCAVVAVITAIGFATGFIAIQNIEWLPGVVQHNLWINGEIVHSWR